MKPSYKDLLTIYYNSLVTPRFDWVDGIIVDRFDVLDNKAEGKIRVLSNIEVPDTMTSMEFFEKLGTSPTNFSKIMYNQKIEDYVGLPKGILFDDLTDIDMKIITKDEVKSELDERIINIFKTNKPITTLGMF
jgi:hypothetical protein